jgi:CheY-like chemotaxis protein
MARALIIEDNRQMADNLRRMLELLGLETEVAYGPRTGLLNLANVPDVVFLDLMMPGMDGFEVLGYIRRQPGLDQIPVIIITSDDQPETARKARDTGALALIIKPPTIEILEKHLQDLKLI